MTNLQPTSDRILASARDLIIAGGYNGFSYADIAAAVGIRKASIHHHFPTKADLVEALVVQYRREVEAGMVYVEQTAAEPFEQIQLYVRYWQGCIADGSRPFCLCALLASEMPLLPPGVAMQVRGHFQALSAALTRMMERGVQGGTLSLAKPAHVEAEIFMAALHGAMLSARANADPDVFVMITSALLERLAKRD